MSFGKRKIPKHLIIEDYYYSRPRKRGYGWIIAAAGVLIISMVVSLSTNAKDNLYQAKSGQLLFKNTQHHYEAAKHLYSQADVLLNRLNARVKLSQSFSNNTDDWQNGVYIFPVPEGTTVNRLEVMMGGEVFYSEFLEEQPASLTDKQSNINEQHGPITFTHHVENIAPGKNVTLRISYTHETSLDGDAFLWPFPTTITARFNFENSEHWPSTTNEMQKEEPFWTFHNSERHLSF